MYPVGNGCQCLQKAHASTVQLVLLYVMQWLCPVVYWTLFIFPFSSILKTSGNNSEMIRKRRMQVVRVPVALVGSPLKDWKSQCGLMTRRDTRDFEQDLQSRPMGAAFCSTNHHLLRFAKTASREKDTPLSPGPVSLSQDVALPTAKADEPLGPPQTHPDSCRRFW